MRDQDVVVLIAESYDTVVDRLEAELGGRGVEVVRMDPTIRSGMVVSMTLEGTRWRGQWSTAHADARIAMTRGVYCGWSPTPATGLSPAAARSWVLLETMSVIGGWANQPWRTIRAALTTRQLTLAADCGLAVPATLACTPGDNLTRFLRTHARVIRRAPHVTPHPDAELTDGESVTADDLRSGTTRDLLVLQAEPTLDHQVRVVAVDDTLFPVRVDPHATGRHPGLGDPVMDASYRMIELPRGVRMGVRCLVSRLGLRLATIDLTVDPSGQWWFHRCVPAANWLDQEDATDTAITASIADILDGSLQC